MYSYTYMHTCIELGLYFTLFVQFQVATPPRCVLRLCYLDKYSCPGAHFLLK